MAQKGLELEEETFSCSICLDLMKSPVTVVCGHSYCGECIKTHWDNEDGKKVYSCPQCRHLFFYRPVLKKNTVLAAVVEGMKKTAVRAAPADDRYAGPEDVACDVCTDRKLKALKSCLVCLASYCDEHLQPHFKSPPFQKHKLVEPSKRLQENICSRHNEVMKLFCQMDRQCICYLCSMDQHKGHDVVLAAAERAQRQRELELSRQEIKKRLQDRTFEVRVLKQEVDAVNHSADKALKDSEKILAELFSLLKKRRSDMSRQIRYHQESVVTQFNELQEKLQQEITELRKKDAELKQLSCMEDDNHFLLNYHSLTPLSPSPHLPKVQVRHPEYFEDVTEALSQIRDRLQDLLTGTWKNISETKTQVDVLLPEPEPKTRAEFLKYSQKITLNPNTAHRLLSLSKGKTMATFSLKETDYSQHADRFLDIFQVLSTNSLTGRCYWEVRWRGEGVTVGVAYKNISRAGILANCAFGSSEKSWALYCDKSICDFGHCNDWSRVLDRMSCRIGVYLDHDAGILSFYSVSCTMTLLHRVQTTFTEPLFAGVRFIYKPGDSAEFCELK